MKAATKWMEEFQPTALNPFDLEAKAHLCRRAAYAAPPGLLRALENKSPAECAQFFVEGETESKDFAKIESNRDVFLFVDGMANLAGGWLARMELTKHPLRQRVAMFWHNHFATGARKVQNPLWMEEQVQAFEGEGMGSFPKLLGRIVKGPAMLKWLDADQNRRGHPNENLGRELLELFTLGRGNYSEKDIQEASRALTGWRIHRGRFSFLRGAHDKGIKVVLGERGNWDGNTLLTLLTQQEACPRFLAKKLCEAFVGPGVPEEAVQDFAQVLRGNDLHIGKSLQVLLASRLFYALRYRGRNIRSPIAFLLWMTRSMEAFMSPRSLYQVAAKLGQRLLDPPDVGGWPVGKAWLAEATWILRARIASRIGRGRKPGPMFPDLEGRFEDFSIEEALDEMMQRLFPQGLPKAKTVLLRQQAEESAGLPKKVCLAGLFGSLCSLPEAWSE
jgi:uncharacterized protein (DUF1800 family)